jgi:sugar/nucleoside kinase (ribokinase family)
MIHVTSIGDVNVDILTETIDNIDEQKIVKDIKLKIGGGAANFAYWLSKLGLKVRLIGLIGNDYFGKFILKELRKAGVDLKLKIVNERTGITFGVQFKDGSKKLITFRGTNELFSIKHVKINEIKGKICYFSGYNLLDNFRKDMINILEKIDKIIAIDPDLKAGIRFKKEEFLRIMKYVNLMFLNEKEFYLVKNLLKKFKGILIIKRGRKGAMILSKDKKIKIKGKKVNVKNPTGGGDVFNAAFIHHFYYNYDLEKCLKFAYEQSIKYISKF